MEKKTLVPTMTVTHMGGTPPRTSDAQPNRRFRVRFDPDTTAELRAAHARLASPRHFVADELPHTEWPESGMTRSESSPSTNPSRFCRPPKPDLGFRDPDLTVGERVAAKAGLRHAIAAVEVDGYLDLGCNDVQLIVAEPRLDDKTDGSLYVSITVNRHLNRVTVDATEELQAEVSYNIASMLATPMLTNRQLSMDLLRRALVVALSEFDVHVAEVVRLPAAE